MREVLCSTPSRICLFGEHLDYLGLEVIASAIDLRFSAHVRPRTDGMVYLKIRDSKLGELNVENTAGRYQERTFDLSQPIVYDKKRDYIKSVFQVLLREGYPLRCGFDIKMDSTIPIGKGMCSSSTMVVVLVKALLEAIEHPEADDAPRIAYLSFLSEVAEFHEPGGMMDHYTSALGGLVHLDFSSGEAVPTPLSLNPDGIFILFDSLQDKDTIQVLADSKYPTLEALESLGKYGIRSIRDFYAHPELEQCTDTLDSFHRRKVLANIDNYRIQREALELIRTGRMTSEKLGELLNRQQANLRDGLQISTPVIDRILEIAMEHGAFGGKFNGSGGGGCLYCFAPRERADEIAAAANDAGYPAMILHPDKGLTIES